MGALLHPHPRVLARAGGNDSAEGPTPTDVAIVKGPGPRASDRPAAVLEATVAVLIRPAGRLHDAIERHKRRDHELRISGPPLVCCRIARPVRRAEVIAIAGLADTDTRQTRPLSPERENEFRPAASPAGGSTMSYGSSFVASCSRIQAIAVFEKSVDPVAICASRSSCSGPSGRWKRVLLAAEPACTREARGSRNCS